MELKGIRVPRFHSLCYTKSASCVCSSSALSFFRLGNCETPASGASSQLFLSIAMAQHTENVASVPPGLRSAAAAARAEVSGIARPQRVKDSAQVHMSVPAPEVAVPQGDTYESLMRLPRALFTEKLKAGSYTDVQACCKALSISTKGSPDELENRLVAYQDDFVGKAESGGRSQPPTTDVEDDSFADSKLPWTSVLPARLPSGGALVDPLPDPWRAYIGTPHATRRSSGAHSGSSPLLNQSIQNLEAFPADTNAPALPPIAPSPAPQQTDDPDSILQALLQSQNALLQGVNEMLANTATTQTLTRFHELQSREMQTYVET